MISRCVGGGVFWTVLRPVQGFSRIVRGLPTSDFLLHISLGLGAADVFWLCPMSCAKAVWPVTGSVSVGCLHGVTESGHVQVASA